MADQDPARRSRIPMVVAVVLLVVTAGIAAYWYLWSLELKGYRLRAGFHELSQVALRCRAAVEDYYGAHRRMPATAKEVSCASDKRSAATPRVELGTIKVAATGSLTQDAGDAWLAYAPACAGGSCNGAPIVAWKCSSGGAVERRHLPADCR